MKLPKSIPTAISDREARFLREVARDRSVIEFGALLGFSTVVLADVAGTLTTVDRHNGYTGPTLNQLISNLHRYGVSDRVKVVEGDALLYCDAKHCNADVAFIDLTGQYELTKGVLDGLETRVALVHDYGRPGCSVDLAISASGYRIVGQVDTLVLCERT